MRCVSVLCIIGVALRATRGDNDGDDLELREESDPGSLSEMADELQYSVEALGLEKYCPHVVKREWAETAAGYQPIMKDLDTALASEEADIKATKNAGKSTEHARNIVRQKQYASLVAHHYALVQLLCLHEKYVGVDNASYAAASAFAALRFAEYTEQLSRQVIQHRQQSIDGLAHRNLAGDLASKVQQKLKEYDRRITELSRSRTPDSSGIQPFIDAYGKLQVFRELAGNLEKRASDLMPKSAWWRGTSVDGALRAMNPQMSEAYRNLMESFVDHFNIRALIRDNLEPTEHLLAINRTGPVMDMPPGKIPAWYSYLPGSHGVGMHCKGSPGHLKMRCDERQQRWTDGCGPRQGWAGSSVTRCAEACDNHNKMKKQMDSEGQFHILLPDFCRYFTFSAEGGCRLHWDECKLTADGGFMDLGAPYQGDLNVWWEARHESWTFRNTEKLDA